ncbi:MAG: hypothetical protein JOZ16_18270 [Methylobacteriaceae bacterium]|nr:hypothetical protein [Methylobacteriaceae bacterium]
MGLSASRLFASLLIMISLAATGTAQPRSTPDAAAQDYVHLVLEIGAHEKGYVDAYFGPPEWRTEAEAHPRGIAELKAEADRIQSVLSAQNVSAQQPVERHRNAWLRANVASARSRLDMIEGARFRFLDEATRLFALTPALHPLATYDPVLARIETLVPGDGPLVERMEDFRRRYVIPPDRLDAVMNAAIAECRRRSLAHMQLPANEQFTMTFVTHQSWSAYNWYQGNNQSLIEVNTDLPIYIDRAVSLGCHEGYPGHHVQGIYNERLYRERGLVEFSVAPLYAPASPINEGGADYGVDLAFPGDERIGFEAKELYPLAGLDPATAPLYGALRKALNDLAGARLTIAAMYLDGEIDRARALELTQRYGLVSRERAEQSLAFTEHYRSYVINYSAGKDLIGAYAERAGNDQTAHWEACERILSEALLPPDLAP